MIYYLLFLEPFTKRAYKLIGQDLPVLVQYIGDQDQYPPGQHGNAKKDSGRDYQRTLPSTLKSLNDRLEKDGASTVYRQSKLDLKPRNMKQCQNIKQVTC